MITQTQIDTLKQHAESQNTTAILAQLEEWQKELNAKTLARPGNVEMILTDQRKGSKVRVIGKQYGKVFLLHKCPFTQGKHVLTHIQSEMKIKKGTKKDMQELAVEIMRHEKWQDIETMLEGIKDHDDVQRVGETDAWKALHKICTGTRYA